MDQDTVGARSGYPSASALPTPKISSQHQTAMSDLEDRINELGKFIGVLVARLKPVSQPEEPVTAAEADPISIVHPVPAIRDLNCLEDYVADHLRIVKAAVEKLAI